MKLPLKIIISISAAAIILAMSLAFAPPYFIAKAEEQLNTYAYLNQDTTLYNTSSLDEPIVVLPKTYFVSVLGVEQNGFTQVNYMDLDGFIKTELLQRVDYEPVTKYEATVKFHVNNDGMKINLRSEPNNSSDSIIVTLDAEAFGHSYGYISGTALIPAVGDKWYYVNTNDGNTNHRGYVYSAHVIVDATPENIIEKVIPPPPPPQTEVTSLTEPMSPAVTAAIAATLCVPAAFIMFLLFKRQPKERKPRHGDGWNA